jgi:TetR/AcrR family transcriptional regulator, mexJK operon transcriptional repressor
MTKISPRAENKRRTRRAIINAARTVFLNEGYTASIDVIAAEAMVGRQTIFNFFKTKDKLFDAVLSEAVVGSIDPEILDVNQDIEQVLRRFADRYSSIALSSEAILLGRLVNAEYLRFPELISRLSDNILSQMIPPLADYFQELKNNNQIVSLDPHLAAERFLASVLGSERMRLSLGGKPSSKAKRKRYLDEAVKYFLQGILTNPGK